MNFFRFRAGHQTDGGNGDDYGWQDGSAAIPLFHGTVRSCLFGRAALPRSDRVARLAHAGHPTAMFPRPNHQAASGAFRPDGVRSRSGKPHDQHCPLLVPQHPHKDVRHDSILPEPDSLLDL